MGIGAELGFAEVSKRFGPLLAVDRLSLDVAPGEFLTILGASGSGKTTALNMVAGFLTLSEGEIRLGGRPISRVPIERRNIGMVFQGYALFPHLTVAENVGFPLRMRHLPRAEIDSKVRAVLELVHLGDYAQRFPRQLSGGQRQRVALARGIVFDPPLLLMDEPLGALDLKLREQMQGEIKRLHREIGCTVLYVTHDQGEAMSLSDRIVIMNRGRIVQTGTPEQIYDRPGSRFAAEFVGETNILPLPVDAVAPGAVTPALVLACLAEPAEARRPWALSVRPDAWRRVAPGSPAAPEELRLKGSVEQVQFLGDVVRYAVRLEGGRGLTVKEPRRLGAASAAVGDEVNIAVACRDMVLVRDEAAVS